MSANDHERTDAPIKPLIVSAVGLAILTVAAMGAMAWLFGYLDSRHQAADPPASPLSAEIERPLVPKLQARPQDELARTRRMEEKLLGEYAWIDEQGGIARIPIERAMDILAQKGLPHRAQPSAGGSGEPQNSTPGGPR